MKISKDKALQNDQCCTVAKKIRGRLAPSPTGYLHLGNAWAFLLAWLAAKSQSGSVILRIEDLDPDRSKIVFTNAIIEDLHWLGLDWDADPNAIKQKQAKQQESQFDYITEEKQIKTDEIDKQRQQSQFDGIYRQSERYALYSAALESLKERDLIYPCYCTRKELRDMAGAPHPSRESRFGDLGAAYPGTCRNLTPEQRETLEKSGRKACWRLRCPQETFSFLDGVYGYQEGSASTWGGDFALQRSDGVMAYQLAVVVDDALMGVNQVVRGVDLLTSTPRQLLLFDLLGYPPPNYAHVPLLCDSEGFRLAKRHHALTLRQLREQGVHAESILGLLACKAGLQERPEAVRATELAEKMAQMRNGSVSKTLFPINLGKQDRLCLTSEEIALLV